MLAGFGDTKMVRWALASAMALEMSHIIHSGSVICSICLICGWPGSGYGADGYTGWAPHSWTVQFHSIVIVFPEKCVGGSYRKWECQRRLAGRKLPLILWWGCWAAGYMGRPQAEALVAYSGPEVCEAHLAIRQIPPDLASFAGELTLPIASN